jgi:hypothetical protein
MHARLQAREKEEMNSGSVEGAKERLEKKKRAWSSRFGNPIWKGCLWLTKVKDLS